MRFAYRVRPTMTSPRSIWRALSSQGYQPDSPAIRLPRWEFVLAGAHSSRRSGPTVVLEAFEAAGS